jgi:hypothetical protein
LPNEILTVGEGDARTAPNFCASQGKQLSPSDPILHVSSFSSMQAVGVLVADFHLLLVSSVLFLLQQE